MTIPENARRPRRWIALCGLLGLGTAAASLLLFLDLRNSALREIAGSAQRAFGGDPVAALIAQAASTEATLEVRNEAVWALGEMRDARALPTLVRLHVQEACDHANLVCQREVRKAIRKINGEMSPLHSLRTGLTKLREWIGVP